MNLIEMENKIRKFWKENNIFRKSINQREGNEDFVFYEGPPTANGKPGIHHVLARAFKDIICRYKTMKGFKVERKAGWDTHGLPVELEIEKDLDINTKQDIEEYGIGKFNQKCKESVWEYQEEWERLTEKMGYWLDLEDPYITYKPEYMETVWFILKQIWEKDLLFEDFKVVPYCPRCGTDLSSHEVAQGYEKITDNAVYVKFPLKGQNNTYLLVWTTTPWTLPGNVAIAVKPDIEYVKIEVDGQQVILAKDRMEALDLHEKKIIDQFKGNKLEGTEYEPPFSFAEVEGKSHFVTTAGFVTTEEGTGLVHVAPAFGEEDMQLRKEKDLPMIVNVTPEAKFKKEVKPWAGKLVTDKKVNKDIVKRLKEKNLLFGQEDYEHEYPFCWRCDSKLIYYAKKSWFIKMSSLREDLLNNNEKINWVPDHIKEGRFGEWLREVKDWALSRERYWGTPLPVWKCNDCGDVKVIGGRKDLLDQKFSTNNYFLIRHGQTPQQTKEKQGIIYDKPEEGPLLTDKGKSQIKERAKKLDSIDVIYSSDLRRTKQTAEIIAEETGKEVHFDKRLRDINLGVWHGRSKEKFYEEYPVSEERFYKTPEEGENWNDCRKRMLNFMEEVEEKHENETILIVSHGRPLWLLEGAMKGWTNSDYMKGRKTTESPKVGELREVEFKELPRNEVGELDFHRPYVDQVKFECEKCSSPMERIPQVIDCWFDSGSMPFAQRHWPFEKPVVGETNSVSEEPSAGMATGFNSIPEELSAPKLFPADYISEAIDQTRGWFYTLLAISTALGYGPSYKNVICLGLVLDEKGEKMSKSKGNIVKPFEVLNEYGADALRWYLYTVNSPGESKQFSEKELEEVLKKFIMTFWNCYNFYDTYTSEEEKGELKLPEKLNALDKWILSKLNLLNKEVTKKLENYSVTAAARILQDFIVSDFSQWYVRRSRGRLQRPESEAEKEEAAAIMRYVLVTLTKLTAPFAPFLSEEIYRNLSYETESVHLTDWPETEENLVDEKLNKEMEVVRKIVQLALKIRSQNGLKVRQPLSKLQVKSGVEVREELLKLVKGEINAKKIDLTEELKKEKNYKTESEGEVSISLNVELNSELEQEGRAREVVRQIQFMRKKAGYEPKDKIMVRFSGGEKLNEVLEQNRAFILEQIRAQGFKKGKKEDLDIEDEVEIKDQKLWIGIKKV